MAFKQRTATCFIRGGPDASGAIPLVTGPLGDEEDSTSKPKIELVMAGQPGIVGTLTVGPNGIDETADTRLSINGGYGAGGGGADWQGYGDLFISGTSGLLDTQTTTLSIVPKTFVTDDDKKTLSITASPPLSDNQEATLFVTATEIPSTGDDFIGNTGSLYIRSNLYDCGVGEDVLENAAFEPFGTLPGSYGDGAFAAYSLRNVVDSYGGAVVEVRRENDDALRDFTASEVAVGDFGEELLDDPSFDDASKWTSDDASFTVTGGAAVNDGTNVATASLAQDFVYDKERADYYILKIVVDAASNFSRVGMQIGKTNNRSFNAFFSISAVGTFSVMLRGDLIDFDVGRFRLYALTGHTMTVSELSLRAYTASELEKWLNANNTEPMANSQEHGWARTLYDQTGNARHLQQTDDTRQARIALRGVLLTGESGATLNNGGLKPTMSFNTDWLQYTDASLGISDYPIFQTSVGGQDVGDSGYSTSLDIQAVSAEYYAQGPRVFSGNQDANYAARDGGTQALPNTGAGLIAPDDDHITTGYSLSATDHYIKADGLSTANDTTNIPFNTPDAILMGRARLGVLDLTLDGFVQEYTIYNTDIESNLDDIHKNANVYYRLYEFAATDSAFGWDTNETSFGAGAAFTNTSAGSAPTLTTQAALNPGFYLVSFDVDSLNNGGGDGTLEIKISGETVYTITGSGDLGNQMFRVQTDGGLFQIASATSSDEWEISNLSVSTDNCRMSLHIETDFDIGNTAPLYISAVSESQDIGMVVEAKDITSANAPLLLKSQEGNDLTLYVKAFLE